MPDVQYHRIMQAPEISKSPHWLAVATIWAGVGLFDATQTVVLMHSQGMHHAWTQLFITLLFSWLPWALATPLIMYLGRRFPPVRLRPVSTWMIHLAAGLGINLVTAAWRAFMEVALNPWANASGPGSFAPIWSKTFYNGLLATIVLYASVLAITYVLDSRERIALQQAEAARLSEQLSRAQLDALRHQIEPHFLFNALNAVAALIREGRNDDAVSTVAGLSDLLRHVLRDSRQQQVQLRDELELLDKYLAIQKVRFSDRLQVEIAIPSDVLSAQVPSLLLQPIVENALKHGISKRLQGGTVRITASRLNGHLKLNVYNDGPLAPDLQNAESGVGLSNLQTRLRGLYGENFEFKLRSPVSGGVEASVSIPYVAAADQER
jgi:two-component system LytT family sensor kinase